MFSLQDHLDGVFLQTEGSCSPPRWTGPFGSLVFAMEAWLIALRVLRLCLLHRGERRWSDCYFRLVWKALGILYLL